MLHVIQSLPKQRGNMVVIQTVEDLSALLACPNEPHLPQAAQMVGDARLGDPDCLGQGRHVLLAVSESCNNANAAGIAERAEQFCHSGGGAFIQARLAAS